jgi:glycosyltransferase involved in cell wall biosynthesis
MDVLILTPQLPFPAYQGTSLRNLHILRGLAQTNRLFLLSYAGFAEEQPLPPELVELCAEIVTVPEPQRPFSRRLWQMLSTNQPDMALRLVSIAYEEALRALLQRRSFDLAQIEGIELAWTIPLFKQAAPDLPLLYDAHNAETLLQARAGAADVGNIRRLPAVYYSKLQRARLSRYEAWVCQTVNQVTAVSEADSQALENLAGLPPGSIPIIPNSIDVASYRPGVQGKKAGVEVIEFDVVFSGKMDYRPNVDAVLWFADEVWPLVREQQPRARWAVVGQKPHPRLERLRQVPGLTLTGWVPDIKPYMSGAKVFIMPFRVGSGTRLKLIEALAAGRAVVSTTVGVEGFPIVDGRQVLLGDTAETFAARILDLLDDPRKRAELGRQGTAFAQNYDWRVIVPRFQPIYESLFHE